MTTTMLEVALPVEDWNGLVALLNKLTPSMSPDEKAFCERFTSHVRYDYWEESYRLSLELQEVNKQLAALP